MTELTFTLTQAELTAYQFAVRDRLIKAPKTTWWERDWVRAVALLALCTGVVLGFDVLSIRLFDQVMDGFAFVCGMLFGGLLVFAVSWMVYADQRRHVVRPDGPTLGAQTLKLSSDGVRLALSNVDVLYRWPAFHHLSRARGLVLLWVEPGSAIAVPERVFENTQTLAAFEAEVAGWIKSGNRPRVE